MVFRIYNKLNLYRTRWFWASAVLLAFLTLAAAPYQHRTSHKLRATALVEVTTDPRGNVTSQVFPITILADGTFRDASIYESRPRPMALGNGVVYEAQKTGVPAGYVTIISGSHSPQGWVALGKWQTASQVEARAEARAKPKPAPTPVALPDERPILHREGQNPAPAATPTPAPQQTPSSSDDSDRPVLHRGTDSSPQATPTPAPTPTTSDDSDRPVLHRGTDSNPQATPTPSPTQPASQPATQPEAEAPPPEDPNRPVLRHRKPGSNEVESAPATVSSKSPASTSSASSAHAPSVTTGTPGAQTFLAVSDAQSTDTRSYEYRWKAGEEEQIAAKMRKLALAQLPGEHAQTSEASLTNVVVRSFDLDLSNDAVVVITAEAPGGSLGPAGKAGRGTSSAKSVPEKSVSRYVTVIARVDIDGNPQKLAGSVTDSSRLDVAPRLELVDAIDVEGTGVAALVFREYDFDQKSFIVYGVGHGTVTKLFEGASEPLKP